MARNQQRGSTIFKSPNPNPTHITERWRGAARGGGATTRRVPTALLRLPLCGGARRRRLDCALQQRPQQRLTARL